LSEATNTSKTKKSAQIDPVNDELRKLRRRRLYLRDRLPGVKAELTALAEEKKSIKANLQQIKNRNRSPEAKTLNRRRLYITERLEWLRNERKALSSERKEVNAKLKTVSAADASA
jgi:hypothetical protein